MTNLKEQFFIETFNCISDFQLKDKFSRNPRRNALVFCVLNGTGNVVIDKISYPLKAGALFCLANTYSYFLQPDSKVQGYVISFDDVFLNLLNESYNEKKYVSILTHLSDCKSIQLNGEVSEYLYQIFTKMAKELKSPGSFHFDLINLYLKLFLKYLERNICFPTNETPTNIQNKLTANFLAEVQINFRKIKKVTEYADKLSVSSNHLNEVVKKQTGFSAQYHIQQRIILEAKCRALNSNSQMKEIAYQLGFENTSHFSKYFRNVSGINFTVYKRNNAFNLY